MHIHGIPDNGLPTKLGTFTYLSVNDNTLMIDRNKDPEDFLYEKCVAPGGKFKDKTESSEDCAHREYFEETDLTLERPLIRRGRLFFDNKDRSFNGKPAEFNFLVYVFEARAYTGVLNYNKDPKGTPIWVPNDRLRSLPMEKGDHFILDLLEKDIMMNHRVVLSDSEEPRCELLG